MLADQLVNESLAVQRAGNGGASSAVEGTQQQQQQQQLADDVAQFQMYAQVGRIPGY